jgi:general stress protein CsbA
MLQDIVGWTVIITLLAASVAAYAHPKTRPYTQKYWWVLVLLIGFVIGFLILRRRVGNPIEGAREEGKAKVTENSHLLDQLVDAAHEQKLRSDVDLRRKLIGAEAPREEFDAKLKAVNEIESSLERRCKLVDLVEGK